MLFEFHRLQNGKKPGSINATYLVAGRMRPQEAGIAAVSGAKDGEDEYMQSSPFKSSPMPRTDEYVEDSPVLSITLTREEDLTGIFYTLAFQW
jgi:DNA polymerase delta subunit 3